MCELSPHDSGGTSPQNKAAATTMTTVGDETMSITSSHVQPLVPHPTPSYTIAGDIPSNEYIAKKMEGLDIGVSAMKLSDLGGNSKHKYVETNQHEMTQEYPEASKWDGVAEEDVMQGLQRLAVVAEDEHKEDSSKSVEHYYSMRLAKIISNGTVKFDARYLN